MLGPALALGSAAAAGVSDFLGGVLSRRVGALPYLCVTQAASLPLAAVLVLISGAAPPNLAGVAEGLAAGIAVGGSLAAFFEATTRAPISIVSPITATGVVVPIVAGVLQGERPSALQAVGMAAALLGMVLVTRSSDDAGRQSVARSGVALSVVAAVGAGLFFWLMAPASHHGVAWAVLLARVIPTITCASIVSARRISLAGLRTPATAPQVALCTVLGLTAVSLYALSTRHGELGIVAVLGSMFPVGVVLLAFVVLHERIDGQQRLGVVILMIAVALMTG